MVGWLEGSVAVIIFLLMKGAAMFVYFYAEEFHFEQAPQTWQYVSMSLVFVGVALLIEVIIVEASPIAVGPGIVAFSSIALAVSFWAIFSQAGGDVI